MPKRFEPGTTDGRSGSSSITRREALTRVALGAAAVGAGSLAWPERALAVPALVDAQCRLAGNGRALAARFSVTGLDPSLPARRSRTAMVRPCTPWRPSWDSRPRRR